MRVRAGKVEEGKDQGLPTVWSSGGSRGRGVIKNERSSVGRCSHKGPSTL